MDISQVRNPYDYRNPVRDAAVFAGRGEEVAAIEYELAQAGVDQPSVCIALHGPRAAGKTSLLYAAERMATTRGLTTARVELIEGDGEPITFFRKLYDELVSAVVDDAKQSGKDLSFDVPAVRRVMAGANDGAVMSSLHFPEAVALAGTGGRVPEAALRADVAYFVRLLGREIALLVDEAQVIAEDSHALSVLRFLTTRVDGLVLVMAGTAGLIGRIREVYSPILRQFKEIEVKAYIEGDDVEDCIVRPLHNAGIYGMSGPSLVSSMRQLTDGNPYEIQLYCHEMFARLQRGLTDGMKLTPEVLEGIRNRMESGGRDVLDRPLIRAVRTMSRNELIAFNVLTSALGDATSDEAWFAYCMTGPQEITRAEYDELRQVLVGQGILTPKDPVRFAVETDLFEEVYARLWSTSKIGTAPHAQVITSRTDVRGMLINRLTALLHDFAQEPLQLYPTCCTRMNAADVEQSFRALETLPDAGPNATPPIDFLHFAILKAGEPAALDLVSITCTYGGHTVERWLFAADTDDIALADTPGFQAAADRITALGGQLTADRVRLPLRSWPAEKWFQKATGQLRSELAENHLTAAYDAYKSGDLVRAQARFQSSFELNPGWEAANCLTYLSLIRGLKDDALEWSGHALALANNPWDRALCHYNTAMAHLLAGRPDPAGEQLAHTAAELDGLSLVNHLIGFLLLPDPDDTTTLHEETSVDLFEAVQRARAALGIVPEATMVTAENAITTHRQNSVDTTALTNRPPVVLSVATEWGSSHGGLSTFNRGLCRALANAGAKVFCVVLDASDAEASSAAGAGVTLLPAPARPGASEDMRLTSRPHLPPGTEPDLVLGHGRLTGHVAEKLVDDFFPAARRLHFVHMAPDDIEWHKPDRANDAALRAEQRTNIERALGRSAHRMVAVGPRLHRQFLAEIKSPAGLSPLRLDPGFNSEGPGVTERIPPDGMPLRVLLLGRVEDAKLKGVDIAAAACGRVAKWLHEERLQDIRLIVRGAPVTEVNAAREAIVGWAASPRLEVVIRPYTSEQNRIGDDLNSASLVIMPSRREGFGLVGLEAITQGIPVLVSSQSGLADLLREQLGHEQASGFVVELKHDDEEDTDTWARAIERKLRDRHGAYRQAAEVRDELAQRVPWSQAANIVLGEFLRQ
jgi:glycosyltransferase involved in cell wall biosynthesis/tetratricopeptide (TPR) repeat protein